MLDIIVKIYKYDENFKIEMNINYTRTERERLWFILDINSFIEIGVLVQTNGVRVVTEYGIVDGKFVYRL